MLITLISLATLLLCWLLVMRRFQCYAQIPLNCKHSWPQPPAMPLLGHAHLFRRVSTHLMLQRAHDIIRQHHRDGRLKVRLGRNQYFFIANPMDLELIFSSPNFIEKSGEYVAFRPWLTEGMFISSAANWAPRRKLVKAAFHLSLLKEFLSIFDKHAQQLVQHLQRYTLEADTHCDMLMEAALCTLDIVCESSLGVEVAAQKQRTIAYVQAVQCVSRTINKKILNLFYRYNPLYCLTQVAARERAALSIIHQFSADIIRRRRAQRATAAIDSLGKPNYLDLLLSSTPALSEAAIQAEVDTLILGGFDTTATTISFLLYNLALHPGYQQLCYEELRQVYGPSEQPDITYESLKQLQLLERCIRETLRMYPAAPLIVRRARDNFDLNGYFVPANGNIIISPMFLGRHPSYFTQPDTFMPERFEQLTVSRANMSNSQQRLPNLLLIPFSAGPRNCVGQRYAMLELKVIMLHLLRRYEFSYVGNAAIEPPLSFQVTLHTQSPLLFQIKRRE